MRSWRHRAAAAQGTVSCRCAGCTCSLAHTPHSDLVWSYSRSQAFYGENIATSPSFVDRHWAGPSRGLDHSLDEGDEDEEAESEEQLTSEYESDSAYDDDELDGSGGDGSSGGVRGAGAAPRRSGNRSSGDYGALDEAHNMEWAEPLPPNALRAGASGLPTGSALGRREVRAGGSMRDRRLSRLADEQDDDRSRSRSRSPKRLGAARGRGVPAALRAQLHDEQSRQQQHHLAFSSDDSSALARCSRPSPTTASSDEFAPAPPTEHTRLLGPGSGPRRRSSATSDAHRRASYAKSSGMSSGARFAAQGYGSSTFWQSWFNTVNALVGVGIL